jgi:hypothetical protein
MSRKRENLNDPQPDGPPQPVTWLALPLPSISCPQNIYPKIYFQVISNPLSHPTFHFPGGFATRILYAFLFSRQCYTSILWKSLRLHCPNNDRWLYESPSSSFCNILEHKLRLKSIYSTNQGTLCTLCRQPCIRNDVHKYVYTWIPHQHINIGSMFEMNPITF